MNASTRACSPNSDHAAGFRRILLIGSEAGAALSIDRSQGHTINSLPAEKTPVPSDWELLWQNDNSLSGYDIVVIDKDAKSLGDPLELLNLAYFCLKPGGALVLTYKKPLGQKRFLPLHRQLQAAGFHKYRLQVRALGEVKLTKAINFCAFKPLQYDNSNILPTDSPNDLKVLHLAGANFHCNFMIEQLRDLSKKGYQVEAAISGPGKLSDNLKQSSIDHSYLYLDFPWGPPLFLRFVKGVFDLVAFLRRKKPDIVHYHIFQSCVMGRLACWVADVPVRITMSPSPFYMAAPAPRLVEQMTAWMDSAILCSSTRIFELYENAGIDANQLRVIRYGDDPLKYDPNAFDAQKVRADLNREYGIPFDSPIITRVSYFYPPLMEMAFTPPDMPGRTIKDHETLIAAMPKVLASYPNAKLLFAGSAVGELGEIYLQSLIEKVNDLGLSDSIIFLGFRKDAQHILGSSDVAVSCSFNHENDGGSKEALLMERPLVATAAGGVPEYVKDKFTGLLVPPGDSNSLADAILQILENPSEALAMGKRGRQFILRQMTLTTTVDQLDTLYKDLYDQPSNGYRPLVTAWRSLLILPIMLLTMMPIFVEHKTTSPSYSGKRGYRLSVIAIRAVFLMPILVLTFFLVYGLDWRTPYGMGADLTNRAKWFFIKLGWKIRNFGSYLIWLGKRIPKRVADLFMALAITMAEFPILVASLLRRQNKTIDLTIAGRGGKPIKIQLLDLPPNLQDGKQGSSTWWLPALWNVLKGEVSIVGPRLTKYDPDKPCRNSLLFMKPGLTGWSQLNYAPTLTEDELEKLDELYAGTYNPMLDAKICAKSLISLAGKR